MNNVGRPPFYETKDELEIGIKDYFEKTPKDEIAITGLALHLGFTSRQALINYEEKEEFIDTIKKAKLKVELEYEKRLISRGNGGDVFALKNFDWKDKFETDNRNDNLNTNSGALSDEQKKLIAERWTTK